MTQPHVSEHDQLLHRLEPARLIVVCGAGGVGKTTVSATLGLARATAGERVVVLTIDPAKRLADALGVTLAGDPRPIEFEGVAPGHFNAAMLDPQAAFERVVDELNVRPADRERLRASRLTKELTTGVAGMQELMAVVELERLARGGHYDTIILDTPPALHVLDLLDAPSRIAGLLAGRMARMVGRASGFAARLGNLPGPGRALGRLWGAELLTEIAVFLEAAAPFGRELEGRIKTVEALLRSDQTAFLLVTSPQARPLTDASTLAKVLAERAHPVAGTIVNRRRSIDRSVLDADVDLSDRAAALLEWSIAVDSAERERLAATTLPAPVATLPELPAGSDVDEALRTLRDLLRPS